MSEMTSTPRNSPTRVAVASLIGTSLEFYDHFIYGTASALVFPALFFSQSDPRTALLLSLVSYGLAFVARPLGAAIFGHFGDRIGRKRVLFLTLMMMGLSTFLIGCLPTYASVGLLAPALLALLRLTQGLALGGEWGGAALMVNESEGSAKGLLGSMVQVASPIGFLLANLIFAGVTAAVSEQAFLSWGWRVPFIASAVLVMVGLYVRMTLAESPEFEKLQASHVTHAQPPLVEVLRNHWGKLAIAVGARAGSDIAWYVFSLFLTVYLVRIGLPKSLALQAGIVAAITQVFAIPFFGHLADRFGSRVVLAGGAIAGMIWAFAFFSLVNTASPALVILACAVGMFIQAALWAPLAAFLPEMFPTHVRCTGAGLGFQLAGIAGGAFAPLIALSLLDSYGSLSVAAYVAFALGFVLVAVAVATRVPVRDNLVMTH